MFIVLYESDRIPALIRHRNCPHHSYPQLEQAHSEQQYFTSDFWALYIYLTTITNKRSVLTGGMILWNKKHVVSN